MLSGILSSLRPEQWIKNLFLFVAPLFAQRIFEPEVAVRSVAGFLLFSAAASAVYLMNDLADRRRDREHPLKQGRPIASGRVPAGVAGGVAIVLGGSATAIGFALEPAFGATLLLYIAIQLAYSLFLRQVVLVDVFCIASGFLLRVLAGAWVVDVPVSSWLILTTTFLSLFLALCKRRAEATLLLSDGGEHRRTLEEYSPEFLDELIAITTGSVVICYSLYTLDERTVREFGTEDLVFTVPFVIFGIFRYLFLVHRREGGGSPATAVLEDRTLAVNGLLWLGLTTWILFR